jgi:cell division initiation protein
MTDAVTPLTPDGIRQIKLQKSMRGYDPSAVDRLLEELAQSLDTLTRERAELKTQVQSLEKELSEHRDATGLMRDALLSAQRAAEELKERTERECEELVAKARADAEEYESSALIEREKAEADVARLRQQELELRASYKVLLHAALDRLGEGAADHDLRPSLLDALAPRRVLSQEQPAPAEPPAAKAAGE